MPYQNSMLASATSTTGYTVTFSPPVAYCKVLSRTAAMDFWVKPVYAAPTVPTTPVATGVVAGWVRLAAALETVTFGVDDRSQPLPSGSATPIVTSGDPIVGLQIWCQTGGANADLVITAH